MRAHWLGVLLCVLPLVASAAGPGRKAVRQFDVQHQAWAGVMRWGDMEERLAFLDSQVVNGLDDFSQSRWEQIRITGYRERGRSMDAEGRMRVRAEVAMVNIHTQTERSVVVDEHWQWLPGEQRWRLVSGLPDLWKGS